MAKFLDLEGLNYFWAKIKSWVLERFAYKSDLNQKLDKLRSGQNIKTINNLSLLGSGNIEIQEGSNAVNSVNGKTGNVTLSANDVGAVPTERTINGKALRSNITLNANDVNALPSSTPIPTKVSDLNNDLNFTSVNIDRKVLTGTNIADITIDGTTTLLYAPTSGGGGGGEENLIESISVNGTAQTIDANKNVDITVPTTLASLSDDVTHRVVTDTEKSTWNGKADKTNTVLETTLSRGRKDNTTVGSNSFAFGNLVTASGSTSHAEGSGASATGSVSHAEGLATTASGMASHAEGWMAQASGDYSHAEGRDTVASGEYSHAEGNGSEATDSNAHSEGNNTTASAPASHAEGKGTIAASTALHVLGKYNISDDNDIYAHIVGNGTYLTHSNAHTLDWSGNGWFAGKVSAGTAVSPANPTSDNDLTTKSYVDSAVTANPTVPSGTTPTSLTGLKVGAGYYSVSSGGGTSTDVLINGSSVTSGGVANIITETAYNATTNKIATMSDLPSVSGFVTSERALPTGGNAGQVLKKVSADPYDVTWANQSETLPSAYCTTSGSTAAKKANCSLYVTQANLYLQVLIGSANTYQGELTLNINSAGAKPIYINGTVSSSSNYTLPNGTYFVFYDGTNYYFRTDGKIHGPDGILYNKPSTGIPVSDLASGVIPDISGKADKTLVASSMPSGGFLPNVVYNLGTLSGDTSFSMAAATDNTIANIWCWTFTTPSTAPTITWPAAITGWSGGSTPTINASKSYEITVMNGLATIIES